MTKRNPTVVIDLELTQPFPDQPDFAGYADALVVCRLRGTPVAAVRVPIADGYLATDALVRELLDVHGWAFAPALAERALADGRLPAWIDVESLLNPYARALTGGPLVTVAVCGDPGDAGLDACVESIRGLDYRHTEVMFVSADDTGRRRAVRDGQGDIIVFVDAGAVLDRQWVSRIVPVFLADPQVMAVTGLTLPRVTAGPMVPTLVRRWQRGLSSLAGGHGARAFWRTSVGELSRIDVDAVLDAGHTVVYEPSALTWMEQTPGVADAGSVAGLLRLPEAARAIDLAEPLRPIADATQYGRLRVVVSWHGVPIGTVHIDHDGAIVSPLWQSDAITQQLAADILDARVHLGRRVVWANIVAGLARGLAPKIEATASRRTSGAASASESPAGSARSPRVTGQAA